MFFKFHNISSGVIEDGISSKENRFQCVLPDLPLNSKEMMSFLKDEPAILCDDVEPWVYCGHDATVSIALNSELVA